jgi:uncharacterized membrane protein YsdA (DUF1294 family)
MSVKISGTNGGFIMLNWKMAGMIYLLIANLAGFAVMGIDKSRAKRHAWRIPEKVLFLASLLGGSIGTWAGMYAFRHKTKHWYFVVGMPLILAVQIAVAWRILA